MAGSPDRTPGPPNDLMPSHDPEPSRIRYGDHPDQFLDRYSAAGTPGLVRGTIISIHGGYWRAKWALDLNDPMARHLAARGWTVANIEYRRNADDDGPSVWDAMAADVATAIQLAVAEDRVDESGRPVVALGHSAGGQLALWAAAQPGLAIDAVVALAPVADLVESDRLGSSDHAARALLGGSADELPERYRATSPISLIPIGCRQLVVHGDADDAVPQSMAIDYAERAAAAGDRVELLAPAGVDHFHIIDPNDPIGQTVWRSIDVWLGELTDPV